MFIFSTCEPRYTRFLVAKMHKWQDFDGAVEARFGDDEQTVMLRLQHRTQQESESIQIELQLNPN